MLTIITVLTMCCVCNVMLNPAEEEHFLPIDITIPPVHCVQRHVCKHTNHIYFMSITTHAV